MPILRNNINPGPVGQVKNNIKPAGLKIVDLSKDMVRIVTYDKRVLIYRFSQEVPDDFRSKHKNNH